MNKKLLILLIILVIIAVLAGLRLTKAGIIFGYRNYNDYPEIKLCFSHNSCQILECQNFDLIPRPRGTCVDFLCKCGYEYCERVGGCL